MLIFWIVWITWWASEILLSIIVRSGKNDKKGQDKGSFILIWFVIAFAMTAGIIISNTFRITISNLNIIRYTGLLVIVTGMIIRFVSIITLGRYFTVDVTIRDDHKIKKDGIYRIVRHPSYTGSILSFIGFGISINNWLSLFTITILISAAFLNRIKVEEKLLIDQFGKDYLDYKSKTYFLIPWIY